MPEIRDDMDLSIQKKGECMELYEDFAFDVKRESSCAHGSISIGGTIYSSRQETTSPSKLWAHWNQQEKLKKVALPPMFCYATYFQT